MIWIIQWIKDWKDYLFLAGPVDYTRFLNALICAVALMAVGNIE
jgi:hypothetical protein